MVERLASCPLLAALEILLAAEVGVLAPHSSERKQSRGNSSSQGKDDCVEILGP